MKLVLRIIGTVASLLVTAVLVLVAMGHREGACHYESVIEINASGEQVSLSSGWRQHCEAEENELVALKGVRTDYDKTARLSIKLNSEGVTADQTYVLTSTAAGGTRVQMHSSLVFGSWFARLIEPVIAQSARGRMAEDLLKLKSVVEAHPAS